MARSITGRFVSPGRPSGVSRRGSSPYRSTSHYATNGEDKQKKRLPPLGTVSSDEYMILAAAREMSPQDISSSIEELNYNISVVFTILPHCSTARMKEEHGHVTMDKMFR